MEYQIKKEITKENILEDFNYYDLLALEEIMLNKDLTINSTRMDLEAKKLKPVKKNGEIGVIQFGIFYSEKDLLKEMEKVEVIADVVTKLLKLKQEYHAFKNDLSNLETKMQFYAEDYKQHWKIIYEEEKWFLVRDKHIPMPPTNWSD